MKVGVSLSISNTGDWDRFIASEAHADVPSLPAKPDAELWDEDMSLGLEVEPLGYDSLFCVEHHFTPYSFSTNPLQLLTWFAGRTERIDLGTMVVVLPWHHPLRVAEEATMLQNLLGDRNLILGLGRGLARREYGSFGIDMGESRQRFQEGVEVLRLALSQERFSYEGEMFTIPETAMRPYPRDQRLLDNLYGAWGSVESAPIVAELGLKPMIVPQKPLADYRDEIDDYHRRRASYGFGPASPVFVTWVYCAETEDEARDGAERHMSGYARSPVLHYEIGGSHLIGQKGYESYSQASEAVRDHGLKVDDMTKALSKIWVENHVWGTPDQCYEKIAKLHADWNPGQLVLSMRYGNMTLEEGQQNLRLFAREVLAAAQALPTLP